MSARAIFVEPDTRQKWLQELEEAQRAIPERWTMEYIALRLIEAFEILRTLPSARLRPMEYGNNWPSIVRDFKDAVSAVDNAEENKQLQLAWDRAHRRVSPEAITRMEATLSWPVKYLRGDPNHSKALLTWAVCKSTPGMSYAKEIKRRGLARQTFERRRRIALGRIRVGLVRDEVRVD